MQLGYETDRRRAVIAKQRHKVVQRAEMRDCRTVLPLDGLVAAGNQKTRCFGIIQNCPDGQPFIPVQRVRNHPARPQKCRGHHK